MKRLRLLAAAVLVLLLILPLGATATSLANDQPEGNGRIIFVHYPQGRGSPFPATDQITNYKYTGIHWPAEAFPIHYTVDPTNNSGLGSNAVKTAIDASFDTWAGYNASNVVTYQDDGLGTVATDPLAATDDKNTVSWRSLAASFPGAIAVTAAWYRIDKGKKLIYEADTVLNSDLPWSINAYDAIFSDSFDVQDITTHETGHWLLLGDLYARKDSELTMYGFGAMGETKKDSLGAGDILGINAIYP